MRKIKGGKGVRLLIVGTGVEGLNIIVVGEFRRKMIHVGHYASLNIIIQVISCVGLLYRFICRKVKYGRARNDRQR